MADFTLPVVRKAEGLHPTAIEWTDYSANPLRAVTRDGQTGWACVKVSPGCANCYAEAINLRFGTKQPFTAKGMEDVRVVLDEQRLAAMLAAQPRGPFRAPDGRPKVFIGDMTDVCGAWVPDETLDRLFAVFALRPDIDWQVLTKRPERMAEYLTAPHRMTRTAIESEAMEMLRRHDRVGSIDRAAWPLPNVWLGTSCEDRRRADDRIPHLLRCPAAVRFLSCEPLLGAIRLAADFGPKVIGESTIFHPRINWVVIGGESGHKSRPCNVHWIRGIVRQCAAASVPCFVKQLGSRSIWVDSEDESISMHLCDPKGGAPSEWPEDLRIREYPRA